MSVNICLFNQEGVTFKPLVQGLFNNGLLGPTSTELVHAKGSAGIR